MELSIQRLSKAFNQKTVFSNISREIPSGARVSITGANGSGKSTLLKILSGGTLASAGTIRYKLHGQVIPDSMVFRYLFLVAPYNTVIEELTLPELFTFHQKVGTLTAFSDYREWVDRLDYPFHPDHRIKAFSSGMKQRVKLGLALLDNRPLLLLDEPGTNLDAQGKTWFFNLLDQLDRRQTLIIATNDPREQAYCGESIQMEHYRK